MRQLNRIEGRMARATGRRGHQGRFCPCCCKGTPADERRAVNRARRRLDRAVVEVEIEAALDSESV